MNSGYLGDKEASNYAHRVAGGPFHMSHHKNVVPTRDDMMDLLSDHKSSDISEAYHSDHNHGDTWD